MFKIGNVEIKNKVVMAPMAGISDAAYMKICEQMHVGYAITELISAEAIIRDNKKTFDMLKGYEKLNIPVAIQLFGSNKEVLSKAAKIVEDMNLFQIIDINMGCPVPKVALRSKSGSALLKDENKVYEIVKSVKDAVSIPVTVKIRSGWDSNSKNAVTIAKIVEKAGAKAITIHGRTRSQMYSGSVDLNIIKQVKENVSIPVIGNGDIKSKEDAKYMLDYTGCDAVMIGRALIGNPWLIEECNLYLENKNIDYKVSIKDRIDMIKRHYSYLKEFKPEKAALLEMRTNALYYFSKIPNSKEYKVRLCSCKNESEFISVLDECLHKLNN